jgi:uncharacterized protein
MRLNFFGFTLAVGLAADVGTVREAMPQAGMTFQQAPITIMTQSGSRYNFIVDTAITDIQAAFGLKYRHDIPPNGGMLILRQQRAPTILSVTTDGVSLPIDLMFIAGDGTIMEVHTCIPTNSTTPWVSNSPVSGALEVACGTIQRLGILAGDKVVGAGFPAH